MVTPKPYNHILETSGQDCAKHDTGTTTGRPGGYGGEKMNWDGIKGFLTTAGLDLTFSVSYDSDLDRAGITIPYPQMDIHMK